MPRYSSAFRDSYESVKTQVQSGAFVLPLILIIRLPLCVPRILIANSYHCEYFDTLSFHELHFKSNGVVIFAVETPFLALSFILCV